MDEIRVAVIGAGRLGTLHALNAFLILGLVGSLTFRAWHGASRRAAMPGT